MCSNRVNMHESSSVKEKDLFAFLSVQNVIYLSVYYIHYICDTFFFTRDLHVGVEHTVDVSPA